MAVTFYFYDLETTSGSPRTGRVMQFAGQRTDEQLQPIGEPDNILVKLAEDILPEPDAILVHKITPQQAQSEGISEADFSAFFQEKVALPGTIFVGYNNIRFDDEFMRRVSYRTFYDPYQWHWKDGRSRWDLLDAIRMMRALRPDGLKWPMLEGKQTVKLELLAKENGFIHENAHDALSDVIALIQLAQQYKKSQPKLFTYLLDLRDKKRVADLALGGKPFVYTSGKYKAEYEKTTLVHSLFKHPDRDGAIVYDLRHDPTKWFDKSVEELVKHWSVRYGDELEPLPLKTMVFNRCPAVAPMGVLDTSAAERISIDIDLCMKHQKMLDDNPAFAEKLKEALESMDGVKQASLPLNDDVDQQLYDGFWGSGDQAEMLKVRRTDPKNFSTLQSVLRNKRIRAMIPLYKARNFPELLAPEERDAWEKHRRKVFYGGSGSGSVKRFSERMQQLGKQKLSADQEYLLTELQLYAESILPVDEDMAE